MRYVLISGWATRPRSLDALNEALALEGTARTCSVHDLPSFQTAATATVEELSEYARGLAGLLESEKRPCALLGWSMGGMIALETACRFPERISHVACICTTARFVSGRETPWGVPLVQIKGLARLLRISPRESLKAFFRRAASPAKPSAERLRNDLDDALSWGVDELVGSLHYLQTVDLRERLETYDIPTLVVHGEKDAIISETGGAELAASLLRGRFVSLPGIGHDAPRRCATKIASLCRELAAETTNEHE